MPKYDLPPPIPDTPPENIAKACMQGPPKKDWDYLKQPVGESGVPAPETDCESGDCDA